MGLDQIAERMRAKGLKRQAVLLESEAAEYYGLCLLNPMWELEVSDALGTDVYEQLFTTIKPSGDERLLLAFFRSRLLRKGPLRTAYTHHADESMITQAFEAAEVLPSLCVQANQLIFSHVQKVTCDDDELLFRMYKDLHAIPDDPRRLQRWRGDYERLIEAKLPRLERYKGTAMMPIELERMLKYFPKFQPAGNAEQDGNSICSLIQHALKDSKVMTGLFEKYIEHRRSTWRGETLKEARNQLENHLDNELIEDECSELTGSELEIWLQVADDPAVNAIPDTMSPLQKLLAAPLRVRQDFLDMYEHDYAYVKDIATGLLQIAHRHRITNPSVDPYSVLQNHAHFPNVLYPANIKRAAKHLAEQMRAYLECIPDISDIAVSSKVRGKQQQRYTVMELPKNPLDLTFGNDSGCCIFVPEDKSKLANGLFVPVYLHDPHIHLFGVYRDTRHRVGLVLAFDALSGSKKILACNSLELSRFGIVGGRSAFQQLTAYVEQWIGAYAQAHGYDGAVMGSHEYNTAQNYSARAGATVKQNMRFAGFARKFYSDIFESDEKGMVLAKNAAYWLWKK